MKNVRSFLKKLTELPGVSGFEECVREVLKTEFEKHCDKIEVDNLGNLIGVKGQGEPKMMFLSHMDEVGLVVKDIGPYGFLRFAKIGYIDHRILLTQDVVVWGKKGPVVGVIGMIDEEDDKIDMDDMFIDVGAKTKKQVEKLGVEIESPVTFATRSVSAGSRFVAKALDNRVGCLILCKLMEKIEPKHTVYFVATRAEEVGSKGAKVSAFGIEPDMAIVVDVTEANDYPGMERKRPKIKLGHGPVIDLIEAGGEGLITDTQVKELILRAAEKRGIKCQLEVSDSDSVTEGTTVQLSRSGIRTGAISVPVRYTHSVSSVVDLKDVKRP
jgi:endoglucanase